MSSAWMFFYERTCEREVGYKQLMIVCPPPSLLRNSATDDKTIMIAAFLQLMQRTIKMVVPE